MQNTLVDDATTNVILVLIKPALCLNLELVAGEQTTSDIHLNAMHMLSSVVAITGASEEVGPGRRNGGMH